MPVTYHFKPFPKPGEAHFEISQTRPGLLAPSSACPCSKEKSPCNKCKHDDSILRRPSQALLSPIKEHPNQTRSDLTPKARRDRRRASSRASVASAFESAVGSDDYFTLFPSQRSRAFARSDSSSSSRSMSGRRKNSGTSSSSRSASLEQTCSPLAENVENASAQSDGSQGEEGEVARRGS